jgi:hypothetical protein
VSRSRAPIERFLSALFEADHDEAGTRMRYVVLGWTGVCVVGWLAVSIVLDLQEPSCDPSELFCFDPAFILIVTALFGLREGPCVYSPAPGDCNADGVR